MTARPRPLDESTVLFGGTARSLARLRGSSNVRARALGGRGPSAVSRNIGPLAARRPSRQWRQPLECSGTLLAERCRPSERDAGELLAGLEGGLHLVLGGHLRVDAQQRLRAAEAHQQPPAALEAEAIAVEGVA